MLVQKQKGDVNNCWLGSNSGYLDTTWAEYIFMSVFHLEYLAAVDFFTSMRLENGYKDSKDAKWMSPSTLRWVENGWNFNFDWTTIPLRELNLSYPHLKKKHKLHMLKGCSSKFWAQKINPFFVHLLVCLLNDSLTIGEVISVSLPTDFSAVTFHFCKLRYKLPTKKFLLMFLA